MFNKNKKLKRILNRVWHLAVFVWVSGGIMLNSLDFAWAVSPVPNDARAIFIEDVSIVDGTWTAYVSMNIPVDEKIWYIKTYGIKYDKDLLTISSISIEDAAVAKWTNQSFIKNYSSFGIIRMQYGRSAIVDWEDALIGDGTTKNIFKIDFTVNDESDLPTDMLLDFSVADSNTILKNENGEDVTSNYVLYDDVTIAKTTDWVIDYSQDVDTVLVMAQSDGAINLGSDKYAIRLNKNQKMDFSAGVAGTTDITINGLSVKQALTDLAGEVVSDIKKVKLNKGASAVLNKLIIESDNFEVQMADGVDIYTDTCWNEYFRSPRNIKNEIARTGFIVNNALAVGWDVTGKCWVMVLSEPAKVTIPEIVGNPFFSNDGGGTWHQISACTGSASDTDAGDLVFPNECFIQSGGETIVWSYHFTEFGMMVPGENYANTQLRMAIDRGEITIGWPTGIVFPNIMASNQEETVDLISSDYFWVEDLKGIDNGYYTTLGVSDLIGSIGSSIPAENFECKVDNSSSVAIALEGSDNNKVEIPSDDIGDVGYDYLSLENPTVYIERKTGVNYKIGKYGVKPAFKIIVPAYKRIGNYTGNITYTLIEN